MKFKHLSLTILLGSLCFANLFGQSIDTRMVASAESNSNEYCATIQIRSTDGGTHIGNSSIRLNYDASVIFFEGATYEVTTGSYTSHNFDNDQTSLHPDCTMANGGFDLTPYSSHGFDGLIQGDILFTTVLLNQNIGEVVFACPNIADEWEDVSTICFAVLNPTGNPNLEFVGTENGPVTDETGTNYNDGTNDPANKHANGSLEGLTVSYNDLTTTPLVSGCTNADACNYNPEANLDDGSCDLGPVWYIDADGDGLGSLEEFIQACEVPEGYVGNFDDDDDMSFSSIESLNSPFGQLKVYPMPAQQKLNIEFQLSSINQPLEINIYKATGQIIETLSIEEVSLENKILVDIENYPKGLYFVGINDGAYQMNFKFIKN